MYIIQNALKSITRNKLRNILIGIIVLVIAISACVALSIRQSAETTKEETLSSMTVTAQISYDRTKAMEEMANSKNATTSKGANEDNRGGRERFDFSVLQGSALTLDEYITYTKALQEEDGYYYSSALSLNATGNLLPYGTEESNETEAATEATKQSQDMPPGIDNMSGMGMMNGMDMSQGDFAITGYSSYDAMLSLFGTDGTYSITEGEMFDSESDTLDCVISDELALYNDLSVDDTITLSNPNYEDEEYTLTICGIYTNSSSSSEENMRFTMNDPANNIYMSCKAVSAITTASEKADNKTTNDNNEETSAVLTSNLSFTYSFATVDSYNNFAQKVYQLGLSEDYIVSSSDISAFENSLAPLETLSTTAMWFFLIVLIVGGIILVTLNIFNLRERKYEVGVLTAIGMKKTKVSLQFLTEIFVVTFITIIIGTSIGAVASVPVTNTLLANQISTAQETQDTIGKNFGFIGENSPDMGNIPNMDNMPEAQSMGSKMERFNNLGNMGQNAENYIDSVSNGTNLMVLLQLVGVGLFLTIISSLSALISIMRYEPLKILSNRS